MARTLFINDMWQQIQDTVQLHGCYCSKNSKNIMEATYACINMQVELGMVSKEQLDNHMVDEQQKYILQPTRMDYRLILKSLGVNPRQSSWKRAD